MTDTAGKTSKYQVNAKKHPGVFGYDSTTHMVFGKPDTTFYITYRIDRKLVWEKIGRRSEGITPHIASEIRSDRTRAARHGDAVKTAKDIAREKRKKDKTLGEIAEHYFSARGDTLKGKKSDQNRYDLHLKPLFANRTVSTIVELDIDRIRSKMKDHAPATIANTLELFRRLINYGVKKGLCEKTKLKIRIPRKDNTVTEYLKPEESARLVEVLDSWKSQDVSRMLKLAMLTGMRRGEIFKLEDHDLDFDMRLVRIRDPKGNKTVSVPMSEPVSALLDQQLKWRNEKFPPSVYVFPGKNGNLRTDCSAVRRIKAKAMLPAKFRIFHGLRHHFAVMLANSGEFSLDQIAELLTHKSIEMTKRYGQFLPETMRIASNRAADIIHGQISKQVNEKSNITQSQ